ncbi:ADP-ribosylation factor 1 [Tritrichomonas foetus]|uniref:ADP-ribosylation factor 1 n=1 Tax=Tritrichomonas foetus TaxID=1144522 RepID=A0A1J4K674_9EUKA|nr:ADP-ribosylation factor 1 [Tritrichomonas foetus]|eukprot:OHT06675.1 ADP-ribosylation factor 1 [Tritrichomonas foetus]
MGCCCSSDSLILLFCGLTGAGKSTIIGQIEYHSFRVTNPTVSTEISYAIYHDRQVEIWDIPGHQADQWMINRKLANGIVFVVDARNRKDIQKFADNALQILNAEDTTDKPILIYINFAAAEKAISEEEIRTLLKIDTFKNQNILIQSCNAKNGDGIIDGYNRIMECIEHQ